MSTTSPLFDTWSSSDDGSSTGSAPLPAFADLPAFQPRRSVLVSWPVRVAQAADRMVARAFAPGAAHGGAAHGGAAHGGAAHGGAGRVLTAITLASLDRWCHLLPAHPEAVLAERARLKIEQLVEERADRVARFLELRHAMEAANEISRELPAESPRSILLNPANCWTRWETDIGLDDESLSASVLFFMSGQELRGIRMRLEGQVLINELADYQPCTIAQWARLSALVGAPQLAVLVRHLAEMGLVAYG